MTSNGQRTLVQCGDLEENKKRILPIASALRALGHTPIILHYSERTGSFFESQDFECVYLNPYKKKINSQNISKILPKVFWEEECLSAYYTRHKLLASPGELLSQELYMLRRDAAAVANLISENDVDSLIVWNGVTGHVANALRLLGEHQGTTAGYLERGYLPNSVFFDVRGTNGASSLSLGMRNIYSEDQVNESVERIRDFVFEKEIVRFESRQQVEKILFLPLQVQLDSNIILYSDRLKTMRSVVTRAVDILENLDSSWIMVIRDHPEEEQKDLNLPFHRRVYRDNATPLPEMLEKCSAVFTVNSTVGLSAAFRSKQVICAGEGTYCNEPFVLRDAGGDPMELADRLIERVHQPRNNEEVVEFASVLLDRHHVWSRGAGRDEFTTSALFHFGTVFSPTEQPTLLQHVQQLLRDLNQKQGRVLVKVELSFDEKISFTYRITERISIAVLKKMFADIYPLINIILHNGFSEYNDGQANVLICPSDRTDFSTTSGNYTAVLDEYCMPHINFYRQTRRSYLDDEQGNV